MDFLALCKRSRQKCRISGTGPAAVTGQTGEMLRVVNWVKEADLEIRSMYLDWKFLWSTATLATVASQATKTGASDMKHWDRSQFRIGTSPLTWNEYADYVDDGATDESEPTDVYVQPDNDLLFKPIPDAIYTVNYAYWAVPTEMSSGTDYPLGSATHAATGMMDRAIVGLVMMKYGDNENAPEIYNEGERLYLVAMKQLEAHQLPRRDNIYGVSDSAEITVVVE